MEASIVHPKESFQKGGFFLTHELPTVLQLFNSRTGSSIIPSRKKRGKSMKHHRTTPYQACFSQVERTKVLHRKTSETPAWCVFENEVPLERIQYAGFSE